MALQWLPGHLYIICWDDILRSRVRVAAVPQNAPCLCGPWPKPALASVGHARSAALQQLKLERGRCIVVGRGLRKSALCDFAGKAAWIFLSSLFPLYSSCYLWTGPLLLATPAPGSPAPAAPASVTSAGLLHRYMYDLVVLPLLLSLWTGSSAPATPVTPPASDPSAPRCVCLFLLFCFFLFFFQDLPQKEARFTFIHTIDTFKNRKTKS